MFFNNPFFATHLTQAVEKRLLLFSDSVCKFGIDLCFPAAVVVVKNQKQGDSDGANDQGPAHLIHLEGAVKSAHLNERPCGLLEHKLVACDGKARKEEVKGKGVLENLESDPV